MPLIRMFLLIVVLVAAISAAAQADPTGSILVQGNQVKVENKKYLTRKRFYLFPADKKQQLIESINKTAITSRDCYYTKINASAGFICWLQQENCDGPFCRTVIAADVPGVPEFDAAYKKGLTLYGGKSNLALSWLIDNLDRNLVTGFYEQQRNLIAHILGKDDKILDNDIVPVQSSMATSTAAEAFFVDVPIRENNGKYIVSNILPVEIGDKSYVWVCEVPDLTPKDFSKVKLDLDVKKTKNCEVIIRDIKVCATGTCTIK